MNEFERRPYETELEHHQRLVYGKFGDNPRYNVNCAKLSPYVYGREYSADVARKMMHGSKHTLDLIDKNWDSEAFLSDSRRKYVEDRLIEAANNLTETIGRMYDPVDDPSEAFIEPEKSEGVLILSDINYGMLTKNVCNWYNPTIALERLQNIVKAAASRVVAHGVRCLHVLILGNLCYGTTVPASDNNEGSVAAQVMHISEALAQSLEYLTDVVPDVRLYCMCGNRIQSESKNGAYDESVERLVGWWLDRRLENNCRVHVLYDFPTEFVRFNVCGYSFIGVNSVNDVEKAALVIPSIFEGVGYVRSDYVLMRSRNCSESFEQAGVRAIACGPLCGTDDEGSKHWSYSTPEQLLLIVTPEDGVDAEYHLRAEYKELIERMD